MEIETESFKTWMVKDPNGLLCIRCKCKVPMNNGKISDHTIVLGKMEIKALKKLLKEEF